jgi:hypothetical protein
VSSGRSKRVIEVDGFDRSKFWEDRDVDISISSMKIKIILPGNHSQRPVVYIRNINVFIFFHIQELPSFTNTLSDFRRSTGMASTANFSFR